jgi:hypothetical protein
MVLPSLDQNKCSEPRRRLNEFHYIIEYLGSEAIQQRRAGVNKKDIDSANVLIRPMKEGDVDVVAVIDSRSFGAPRPEHYRQKLGSAAKVAGINTSLVGEARTSIPQVDCKG